MNSLLCLSQSSSTSQRLFTVLFFLLGCSYLFSNVSNVTSGFALSFAPYILSNCFSYQKYSIWAPVGPSISSFQRFQTTVIVYCLIWGNNLLECSLSSALIFFHKAVWFWDFNNLSFLACIRFTNTSSPSAFQICLL